MHPGVVLALIGACFVAVHLYRAYLPAQSELQQLLLKFASSCTGASTDLPASTRK